MENTTAFFYEHAGYSIASGETEEQGRMRAATALAQAEHYAADAGWTYEWLDDDSGCSGCDCDSPDCACISGTPHETLGCVLKDVTGTVLASLWGICGATREYGRVVEAELALEAMHNELATAR